MKKIIPILLLVVFFLFQGGKILLYVKCSVTTPSCDCVKIFADSKPGPEALPNHKHLAEEFEMLTTTPDDKFVLLISSNHVAGTGFIPAGVSTDVFHPPAV